MNKGKIEILNKCDNCKLKECIGCKFTWTEMQEAKKYITELEQKESILDKVADELKETERELYDDGYGYYGHDITKILNIIEGEKK